MGPIEEILSILSSDEPLTAEQQARIAELSAQLEDEQLAELESELQDAFDALRSQDELTAESVARLSEIADVVDGVRYLAGERNAAAEAEAQAAAEAAAAQEAALAELDRRVRAEADGDEDEDEGDGDEGDESGDESTDDGDGEDDGDEVDDPEATAPTQQPVAASTRTAAKPATRTTPIANLKSRVPEKHKPSPRHMGRITIREAGSGRELANSREVGEALLERHESMEGTGQGGRFRVATFSGVYPKDRIFAEGRITDVDEIVGEIAAKVSEPGGVQSLVADGGICAPVENYYGLQTIAQASRPLKSAITSFMAKRGGIKWMPPMTLADILTATTPTSGRAVGVVSEANDAASTYDKSVQAISCSTAVEKRVDAVYRQLEFGNFIDRTNPERVAQFTDLSIAAYARFSEQRLFNAMVANSTYTHTTQALGASRDLITFLNRAAINYRGRHRMPVDAPLDCVLPAWVGMGLLPDDQFRAIQSGDGAQFQITQAWVDARLRERNINVTCWFQDDFTTSLTVGGQINSYPSSFTALLYHPGAHVYIDNGSLDIGVIRDSVLTVSNVFRTFTEEFWTTGMWGVESQAIGFSLCANGASAGTVAPKCGS